MALSSDGACDLRTQGLKDSTSHLCGLKDRYACTPLHVEMLCEHLFQNQNVRVWLLLINLGR